MISASLVLLHYLAIAPGPTFIVGAGSRLAITLLQPLPVKFARKALVKFGRQNMHDSEGPLPHYTLAFQPGSYLHFKQVSLQYVCVARASSTLTVVYVVLAQEYNSEWWIGRVVGPDPGLGFLPRLVCQARLWCWSYPHDLPFLPSSEARLRATITDDVTEKGFGDKVQQYYVYIYVLRCQST